LKFNSNFPGRGLIKIGNVWPVPEEGWTLLNEVIDVFIDKKKVEFQVEKKNSDVSVVVSTDFRSHTLRIIPKK